MAAITFSNFALLPFELRHDIWESLLPEDNEPAVQALIRCLSKHILKMPRERLSSITGRGEYSTTRSTISWDNTVGRFVRNKLDNTIDASPYADFLGCTESRVVALKHIRKLLVQDKGMKRWLAKRDFQFYFPKLELDKFNGALLYKCKGITEPAGYHVENVFWEPSPPAPVIEEARETLAIESKEEKVEESLSVSGASKRKREAEEEGEFLEYEPEFDLTWEPLEEGVTWDDESDDDKVKEPSAKRQKK